MQLDPTALPERIARRIVVDPESGCWNWSGPLSTKGYGQATLGGRTVRLHRYAYEQLVGPIAPEPDHVRERGCRSRACCNPAHLEPVTHRENVRRGVGPSGINARKTHCKRGHEFTPENTLRDRRGHRTCRTCRRAYEAELRQERAPRSCIDCDGPITGVVSVRCTSCAATARRLTHCKQGHELIPENTRHERDGHRRCRTCCCERAARRAAERRVVREVCADA